MPRRSSKRAEDDGIKVIRAQALLGKAHSSSRDAHSDLASAIALYEKCRSVGRTLRNPAMAASVEAAALGGLGKLHESRGDPSQAVFHSGAALALSQRIGDLEGQATHHGNLGSSLLRVGRAEEAHHHLHGAKALGRAAGRREQEGTIEEGLGDVTAELGRHAEAVAHYASAVAQTRALGGAWEVCAAHRAYRATGPTAQLSYSAAGAS